MRLASAPVESSNFRKREPRVRGRATPSAPIVISGGRVARMTRSAVPTVETSQQSAIPTVIGPASTGTANVTTL